MPGSNATSGWLTKDGVAHSIQRDITLHKCIRRLWDSEVKSPTLGQTNSYETGDLIYIQTHPENADFTEIRSTLDFIMTSLGYYHGLKVQPGKNASYLDGRYGEIYINGDNIGEMGEIHPEVLLNFKLEFPVAALELDLQKFL